MPEVTGRPDRHTGIDEKVQQSAEGANNDTKSERTIGTQNSESSKIEQLDKKIKNLEGYLNKPNLSEADRQNVENRKAELGAERDTLLEQQKPEPTENEASTPPPDEDTQFRNEYSDPNSPPVESATDDTDFRDEYSGDSNLSDTSSSEPTDSGGEVSWLS